MMPKNALQRPPSALAARDLSPAVPVQPADEQLAQQSRPEPTLVAQVKIQALEAVNNAFCEHIYSTALQHLNHHYNEDAVGKQFMDILDKDDPFDTPCSTGNHSGNSCKNRYRDVIPYDHNRVVLPPAHHGSPTPSDPASCSIGHSSSGTHVLSSSNSSHHSSIEDTTYINASYMPDSSGQAIGYIATQGPLPNTVADFWRMVAVTNSSAIVMLTGLTDGSPTLGNSRPRCAAYFPDQEQDCLCLPGGITVTCVHKNNLDENVFFRQLEVVWTTSPSHQHLWINHYQYSAWPDFGVPSSTHSVLALCHALDSCRRPGCKTIVHCSAGVGRTGTFIAIDILLQRLHSLTLQLHGSVKDEEVCAAMDIPALVISLRKQRRGTVQTGDQYTFIWRAVMDELAVLLQPKEQEQQMDQHQQLR